MAQWTLDPAHSVVSFVARHMMVTKVRGTFSGVKSTVWFDPAQPTAGRVETEIDVNTVDTGSDQRDGHLRSPDFFDVANFPAMTFVSTGVEVTGENSAVITGDLTIRGVTRPVKLETSYLGIVKDPWGNQKLAFEASTRINREDWGLTWNVGLEAGGWLVSKEITIELETQYAVVSETQPA
jgi:polyisoprenoid-binding protein YceI